MLRYLAWEQNYGQKRKKNKIQKTNFRKKFCQMSLDPVIKMFDNLKEKIHKADVFGLRSLH